MCFLLSAVAGDVCQDPVASDVCQRSCIHGLDARISVAGSAAKRSDRHSAMCARIRTVGCQDLSDAVVQTMLQTRKMTMLKQICRLLALCRYSLRAYETKVVVRGRARGNYVWLGDGGALSGL